MTAAPLRRPHVSPPISTSFPAHLSAHLSAPVPPAVYELLERSRTTLEGACRTSDASERYLESHLGALRAAAALVAARTTPSPRSRPRSVWQVLPALAPDLGEWATFFAGTASRRAVIDRGGWLSAREADDLLRQAEMFLEIVQDQLGIPQTVPLPDSITPVVPSRPVTTSTPTTSTPTMPTPTTSYTDGPGDQTGRITQTDSTTPGRGPWSG